MWSVAKLSAGALIAFALSACSSITPITITTSKGARYEGKAWTTYTSGRIEAGPCRGSFNEPVIELHCSDGTHGVGQTVLNRGSFGGGLVRLSNGTQASVAPVGSDLTYSVIPGGTKVLTTGWQLPEKSAVLPPFIANRIP